MLDRVKLGNIPGAQSSYSYPMKLAISCISLVTGLLVGIVSAAAQDATYPERPEERAFIVDKANLISPGDAQKIIQIADSLLTDKKVPIIVVTIHGLASQDAPGWTIERYARKSR